MNYFIIIIIDTSLLILYTLSHCYSIPLDYSKGTRTSIFKINLTTAAVPSMCYVYVVRKTSQQHEWNPLYTRILC